ncbi:adhesion G protein-coupled receptor E1-like [Anabas testudineus]|uniref:adhesion G protein-coupled receptor E1-like n=1 Tax=Anabas testudineus TaxID=64144 RepID=UPI000E45D39C|nr:adhesion G protein-coupled receptor E1-like [Anabas testudineus]
MDECNELPKPCGDNAKCFNNIGSYYCQCLSGYQNIRGSVNFTLDGQCQDVDECLEAEKKQEELCGKKGTCVNVDGNYLCECPEGYTNYGIERAPCSELDYDSISHDSGAAQHTFRLILVIKIVLIISLLCLVLCILIFKFFRSSIAGTHTTIPLHLESA